jgi:hypothetical protein
VDSRADLELSATSAARLATSPASAPPTVAASAVLREDTLPVDVSRLATLAVVTVRYPELSSTVLFADGFSRPSLP